MSLVDLGKRLLESAKLGETEEVRLLMSNGAPFTTDWLGSSPLHMAAQYGHLATAEVLLRAGISKDARTKVDRTPLHIAAQEGHAEIVELLIKHGAEVDAKDMLRMTPLHWAVERGHMKVILCLLKHNADMSSLNKFNKTPYDIAEYNCQKEILQILECHASNSLRSNDKLNTSANKSVQLLQLPPTTVPTVKRAIPVTTKADSVENVNKSTTSSPTIVTAAAATPTNASNAKPASQRPILLQANLAHIQKAAAAAAIAAGGTTKTPSSDSEEGDSSDQSCTNVLATLAALAEATAPNASMSASDAWQWLESHGITMLPTDNSTVVASAIESGHTVALTEAGKLALTWVKEQQSLNNIAEDSSPVQETVESSGLPNTPNSLNQKVITIVADHSQLPSIISQQTPIVVMGSQSVQSAGVKISDGPPVKKIKTIIPKKEQIKPMTNGKVLNLELSAEEEKLKLQRELDKTRKEAEQYRVQLLQKAREAEQYRKQLEEMRSLSQNNQ